MGFTFLTQHGKKNTSPSRRSLFTFEKRLLFSIISTGLPGVVLGVLLFGQILIRLITRSRELLYYWSFGSA